MSRSVIAVTTAVGLIVLATHLDVRGQESPNAEADGNSQRTTSEVESELEPTLGADVSQPGATSAEQPVARSATESPRVTAKQVSGQRQTREPERSQLDDPQRDMAERAVPPSPIVPRVVERVGLNDEPALTRAEVARPMFESSYQGSVDAAGPIGELDSRQLLFEPGEPVQRDEAPLVTGPGRILVLGSNGPPEIEGMARRDKTEQIYGRLRRVMELGRNPQ